MIPTIIRYDSILSFKVSIVQLLKETGKVLASSKKKAGLFTVLSMTSCLFSRRSFQHSDCHFGIGRVDHAVRIEGGEGADMIKRVIL